MPRSPPFPQALFHGLSIHDISPSFYTNRKGNSWDGPSLSAQSALACKSVMLSLNNKARIFQQGIKLFCESNTLLDLLWWISILINNNIVLYNGSIY